MYDHDSAGFLFFQKKNSALICTNFNEYDAKNTLEPQCKTPTNAHIH